MCAFTDRVLHMYIHEWCVCGEDVVLYVCTRTRRGSACARAQDIICIPHPARRKPQLSSAWRQWGILEAEAGSSLPQPSG